MPGRLEAIWIKAAHRAEMTSVPSAQAIAGSGLDGNVKQKDKRQVTLLSAEAWTEACRELGQDLDPVLRRANLLVRGIDLENSRGRLLQVGRAAILIHGETKPCQRMDEASRGLRRRLAPKWRGGAHGEVIGNGKIAVGDQVSWIRDSSPNSSPGA